MCSLTQIRCTTALHRNAAWPGSGMLSNLTTVFLHAGDGTLAHGGQGIPGRKRRAFRRQAQDARNVIVVAL